MKSDDESKSAATISGWTTADPSVHRGLSDSRSLDMLKADILTLLEQTGVAEPCAGYLPPYRYSLLPLADFNNASDDLLRDPRRAIQPLLPPLHPNPVRKEGILNEYLHLSYQRQLKVTLGSWSDLGPDLTFVQKEGIHRVLQAFTRVELRRLCVPIRVIEIGANVLPCGDSSPTVSVWLRLQMKVVDSRAPMDSDDSRSENCIFLHDRQVIWTITNVNAPLLPTPTEVARIIQRGILHAVEHEIGECLHIDGVQPIDLHGPHELTKLTF